MEQALSQLPPLLAAHRACRRGLLAGALIAFPLGSGDAAATAAGAVAAAASVIQPSPGWRCCRDGAAAVWVGASPRRWASACAPSVSSPLPGADPLQPAADAAQHRRRIRASTPRCARRRARRHDRPPAASAGRSAAGAAHPRRRLRTATVWTVGMATALHAGRRSPLGNLIFAGLQTATPRRCLCLLRRLPPCWRCCSTASSAQWRSG